jgi:hypothetical protein
VFGAASAAQPASQTLQYYWASYGAKDTATSQAALQLVLPTPLILGRGIGSRRPRRCSTSGDNFGAPLYLVEEWIEG